MDADSRTIPPPGGVPLQAAGGFLLGAAAFHLSVVMPDAPWGALAAPLAIFLRRWRWLVGIAGLAYLHAWLVAGMALQHRMDPSMDGTERIICGEVAGLPRHREQRTSFLLGVQQSSSKPSTLRQLRISSDGLKLQAGHSLCARVRLRSPRAFANPASHDAERWMLVHGIDGGGYALELTLDRRRANHIDAWRDAWSGRIAGRLPDDRSTALLRTIMLADRRGLAEPDQDRLRQTGTAHLAAISGLHLTVAASLGVGIAWLCARWLPWRGRLRRLLFLIGGLTSSGIYLLLAGCPLSAQRAFVAFAVGGLCLARRRQGLAYGPLCWALVGVLLLDPLAPLDAAFWLSFGAVTILYLTLRGSRSGGWRLLLQAQLTLCLTMPLLGGVLFGETPILAVPANLFAVPWTSAVLVPLALAALVIEASGLPNPVLWLAYAAARVLWFSVELAGQITPTMSTDMGFVLLLLFAPILLAWLWRPGSRLAPLVVVLCLAWMARDVQRPAMNGFVMQVIDVGQGLAILIQTRHHVLLYDAGPRFPGGFDVGASEVLPAVRRAGRLDLFVVSHWDLDHAGGASAVRRAFPGVPVVAPDARGSERCAAGRRWRWDGVEFEFLHPGRYLPYLGNDSSCVLLIRGEHGSALLTGDIGATVERALTRRHALDVDTLILSHHGSLTPARRTCCGPRRQPGPWPPRATRTASGCQRQRWRPAWRPLAQTCCRRQTRGSWNSALMVAAVLRPARGPGARATDGASGRVWATCNRPFCTTLTPKPVSCAGQFEHWSERHCLRSSLPAAG